MPISTGDPLPDVDLLRMGANGPEAVNMQTLTKGRKVVMFAVPGAFTPTCHSAHVPSFIRVMDGLAAKGVDEVICLSVNDPFVMQAWGVETRATAAGITMLADADAAFTKAIGMDFTVAPAGLITRCQRFAALIEDGVVSILNIETAKGSCEISGGEALLEQIPA
ncbi:MAG: peroxiredoxin [Pelagimonas sp.]|jgi:cytochrome c peroxidase|nr:peroxiredoxin [Pelagimonas sp.]